MNHGPTLFLGLFVAMACSWLAFVFGPQIQIGDTHVTTNIIIGASGQTYPNAQSGTAHQGAEVYRANGCAACHTQQVRPREQGSDIDRGWGVRRSTAYDYLYDQPVMLGSQRIGPDLANAGRRMDYKTILMHLYEPKSITKGSLMPPFTYLFTMHKITGIPSEDALPLTGEFAPPSGYEIIPRAKAEVLADYIMSLHQDGYLFEAPPPAALMAKSKTNAPAANAAATNAPAGTAATNAPAK